MQGIKVIGGRTQGKDVGTSIVKWVREEMNNDGGSGLKVRLEVSNKENIAPAIFEPKLNVPNINKRKKVIETVKKHEVLGLIIGNNMSKELIGSLEDRNLRSGGWCSGLWQGLRNNTVVADFSGDDSASGAPKNQINSNSSDLCIDGSSSEIEADGIGGRLKRWKRLTRKKVVGSEVQ